MILQNTEAVCNISSLQYAVLIINWNLFHILYECLHRFRKHKSSGVVWNGGGGGSGREGVGFILKYLTLC